MIRICNARVTNFQNIKVYISGIYSFIPFKPKVFETEEKCKKANGFKANAF